MAEQFPATGQWGIYSVQKSLPISGQLGAIFGGVHNYLVLVDPTGKNIQELHGVYTKEFTLGGTSAGNYLQVRMYTPNSYMSGQSILSQNLVMSGSQTNMTNLFKNAFDAVANSLNSKHDLYEGASLIDSSNTYNSNSVWYTAMKVLGVTTPSQFEGSYRGPGDTLDLRTAPSNNSDFGDPVKDPYKANPANNIIFSNQSSDISNPDNGYKVTMYNDGNAQITLTPESGSGLSRVIDMNANGVMVMVGGNARMVGGVSSSVSLNSSGNISVTSAPVGGWTQTTTLNQSGVTTQTFAAQDANGKPINISDIFAPMVAPVVNQITIGGSTFNNGNIHRVAANDNNEGVKYVA